MEHMEPLALVVQPVLIPACGPWGGKGLGMERTSNIIAGKEKAGDRAELATSQGWHNTPYFSFPS